MSIVWRMNNGTKVPSAPHPPQSTKWKIEERNGALCYAPNQSMNDDGDDEEYDEIKTFSVSQISELQEMLK